MRVVLVVTCVLLVTGCGGKGRTVIVSVDGGGVKKDARDGRLDQNWSCGSLRSAIARYSPAVMNSVGAYAAAAQTCDRAINRIDVATSSSGVRDSMGSPEGAVVLRDKRCWFYTWPRNLASPNAGSARICFKGSKVSLVQRQLAPLN